MYCKLCMYCKLESPASISYHQPHLRFQLKSTITSVLSHQLRAIEKRRQPFPSGLHQSHDRFKSDIDNT